MERNHICTSFIELISGSTNKFSIAYTEAANAVTNNDTALRYLKNFIASIENVASKNGAVDKRICDSKGNMKDFVGYDNIEKSLKFLRTHKTPSGSSITTNLITIHDMLEKYQPFYTEGYRENNRLLMREYECALYLLVTGLTMALSFSFEVTDASGTTKIVPKAKAYFGTTGKKIHEMAEELSHKDHRAYLDGLEKLSTGEAVNESVIFTEAWTDIVASTISMIGALWGAGKSVFHLGVNAVKTMKKTIFGIVPLIRGVMYLSYKRKADTILALEQNILFIERNIDILSNKQTMDRDKKEVIIKKQRAQIEAYRKKAEKLRAQLEEGEKEAASAIAKEDSKLKIPAKGDDDFVLENSDNSLFEELRDQNRNTTMGMSNNMNRGDA